jgi:hypothetical protein
VFLGKDIGVLGFFDRPSILEGITEKGHLLELFFGDLDVGGDILDLDGRTRHALIYIGAYGLFAYFTSPLTGI